MSLTEAYRESDMGVLAGVASKVLVLNAGSSSLKFKVFDLASLQSGIGGIIERIGDTVNSCLVAKKTGTQGPQKWNEKIPVADHVSAVERILTFLSDNESKSIDKEVSAVGHRIVHGLDTHKAVLINQSVVDKIKTAVALAPLHNPPGLAGIHAAQTVFTEVPQVAVFDTAYHQTMPSSAYMYGLPYEYYTNDLVRRYGFHGTSHKYLVNVAADRLNRPVSQVNAITCHLGNGSSITAVKNGISVDTSMGMTPLEGLMMGTRSGDLDPAAVLYIMDRHNLTTKQMDVVLNKQSGLLGVCGQNDLRSVIDLRESGDVKGTLALDMFVHRVRKYIGSYLTVLDGRVDALIFSAGIGENSSYIRKMILEGLQPLGIVYDEAKNKEMVGGNEGEINKPNSQVKVLVIPTDEELSIAQQTVEVVKG